MRILELHRLSANIIIEYGKPIQLKTQFIQSHFEIRNHSRNKCWPLEIISIQTFFVHLYSMKWSDKQIKIVFY